MVSILKTWGCVPVGLDSAEEARQLLDREKFDAVLLDLNLPGLNGNEFLKLLRAEPKHALLPVLMLTGEHGRDVRRLAAAAGVSVFMQKPFDAEELLLSLASLLTQKRVVETLEPSANLLYSLVRTLEAKDTYTCGHSEQVAMMATSIGREMGLGEADLTALAQGGLLHDIGKIGIPDSMLLKAGPLTAEERRYVESHPERGVVIVQNLLTMEHTLPVIRSHHERCDGSGYPDGLRGDEIPLVARITAFADVFDALTARRPYREPFSHGRTMEIIKQDAKRGLLDFDLFGYFEQVANRPGEQAVRG